MKIYINISGAATLKQFNGESDMVKRIGVQLDALASKNKMKNLTLSNTSNFIIALVFVTQNIFIGIIAILINKGEMSIGSYLSMSQYLSLTYVPILSFQSMNISLKPAAVAYKRLSNFYSCVPIQNKKERITSVNSITIQNLSFHYPEKQNILNNINLSLQRGDKLLLQGANGSGKTTFSKILLGFYDDFEGSVLFDDVDVRQIEEKNLRSHISLLPQKVFLFNCSLEDNIRIANKGLSETEFQKRIMYFQQINLLKGLDLKQQVLDNGKNLSGGQIQRIALARILLRDTSVCVFDEFDTALDKDAKGIVEEIIKAEFNHKICIFIMHDNHLKGICNKTLNLNAQ